MLRDLDHSTLSDVTAALLAVPSLAPALRSSATRPARRVGSLARFQADLDALWSEVEPLCVAHDRPDALLMKARFWRLGVESNPTHANELVLELEALAAGWQHFDDEKRQVLSGALGYLATMPSADEDDLRHADDVVGAAVRAVIGRLVA